MPYSWEIKRVPDFHGDEPRWQETFGTLLSENSILLAVDNLKMNPPYSPFAGFSTRRKGREWIFIWWDSPHSGHCVRESERGGNPLYFLVNYIQLCRFHSYRVTINSYWSCGHLNFSRESEKNLLSAHRIYNRQVLCSCGRILWRGTLFRIHEFNEGTYFVKTIYKSCVDKKSFEWKVKVANNIYKIIN